jgi:hypothetical protein
MTQIAQTVGNAVGGFSGGLLGPIFGGNAAQSAAEAQQGVANQQLQFAQNTQQQALGYAAPSFNELMAQQNQLNMSSQLLTTQLGQLQQQYSLYQQTAGQASALMNGQAASTLAPLQAEQQLQTQQMQQQLQSQLGSGYAGSSAGAAALANLAMQQNFATSQAQQQATAMYLGAAGQQGAQLTQGYNNAFAQAGNLNQSANTMMQNQQGLQIGALTNMMPSINAGYNNAIGTAGAQYTSAIQTGQMLSSLAGTGIGALAGGKPSGGAA